MTHSSSRFWAELGESHRRDLDAFGPDQVKRRQALRYFTWRWRPGAIARSEQFRFLLRHSSPSTLAACAGARVDLSDESWHGVTWSRLERWLYVFSVRLLWEYARRNDPLGVTDLEEPSLGDPLPVIWRGRLISQDLANGALEAAAISRALAGAEPSSILEIGAGYGRLGHVLLSVYGRSSYTVVDIEPALTLSRWYLSRLHPSRCLHFLAPEETAGILDESASLALSVSSLQEMTPTQVKEYLCMLDRVAAGGTVYIKQWASWRNPADGFTMRFDHYPIPSRWIPLFNESAPVQTSFRQAAWDVPRGPR
ncbi:MAG: putative sugar O-methyltransferase [Actinomycetota bacterium]|nr:putative sugar O-methyltransferase [Actinomycetota bacterium]